MAKKLSQDEIATALRAFVKAANTKYGNDSFAAGYMATLLEVTVKDMPAAQQKLIVQALLVQINNFTEVTI